MVQKIRALSRECRLSLLSRGLGASRNSGVRLLLLLIAAVTGAGCNGGGGSRDPHKPTPTATASPTATPTPLACTTGNAFTFTSNESYPIWLAELYQGLGNLAQNTIEPPGNNWEIASKSSLSLCMPGEWLQRSNRRPTLGAGVRGELLCAELHQRPQRELPGQFADYRSSYFGVGTDPVRQWYALPKRRMRKWHLRCGMQ